MSPFAMRNVSFTTEPSGLKMAATAALPDALRTFERSSTMATKLPLSSATTSPPKRVICFGEYQMAVSHVPEPLDAGEIGRRMRIRTGARLSVSTREGDSIVWIGCNEEKRP